MTEIKGTVNTVLGPVAADELGVVSVHEALIATLPGAQYAYDLQLDRAELFETLAAKLTEFRERGGGSIVDATGMFAGRDLPLYEALARTTGVHLIASTGMGPEEMLGGYFLTPQTNPPTPWPAEKFAGLFAAEVTEGMVVPRLERRAAAGLIVTATSPVGMTATDQSLVRGAAKAALATGAAVSVRPGTDPEAVLDVLLDEALPADRVVIGGLDRAEPFAADAPLAIAKRGAYVALDQIGSADAGPSDAQRADLVARLIEAGAGERVLLSSSATGVAIGQAGNPLPYSRILTDFVPRLTERGVSEEDVDRILQANPRDLLTVRPRRS